MTRFHFQPLGLPVCLVLVVLSGCATKELTLSKALPWPSADKKYETPEKVIAIWTDAVYQLPGKAPTRGFGGRVYFYNANDEVIPVGGQLVVYAFDDSDPNASADRPSRRYAFTSDQLTRYYGESDLGASYNIWIPWDAVGGDEKQVALFPVFIDDSGKTVRGTFANNRLPGKRIFSEEERRGFYISRKRRQGSQVISQQESGVKPVGYEAEVPEEAATGDSAQPGLMTHTIRVPRSLSERMASNALIVPQQPAIHAAANPESGTANAPWTPRAQTAPVGDASPAVNNSAPRGSTVQPLQPVTPAIEQNPKSPYPTPAGSPPRSPSVPNAASANPAAGQTPQLGQQGFIGADPQFSMSARSRAWARQDSRAAHFEPPQFRVPTSPGSRSRLGRAPMQPTLLAPQYSLPSTQ
jgi:hypothetical protein